MSSRINTRSSVRNMAPSKPTISMGLRGNSENIQKHVLPGGKTVMGLGLKDSSKQILGGVKRKAETLVDNGNVTKKRSVLGDVTNAIEKTISHGRKEVQKLGFQKKTANSSNNNKAVKKPAKQTKSLAPAKGVLASVTALPETQTLRAPLATHEDILEDDEAESAADISYCDALTSSQDNNNTAILSNITSNNSNNVSQVGNTKNLLPSLDSSNYVTASETSPVMHKLAKATLDSSSSANTTEVVPEETTKDDDEEPYVLPEGVEDYDRDCQMDPFAVAQYANDIFQYYKQRESVFAIEKYLDRQPEITQSMRSILVDWMVEVQESFELNHETLYLAVKLVDLYLSKVVISRDQLQLVGSTALFIACKFDERIPPYVDDFLYICDDAYKRKELIHFEMKMLRAVGYDLGIPLSYRYLRRYARCAKVSMEELTLARFILEMSLMEYDLLDVSDSAVAAAALLLARYMMAGDSEDRRSTCWTPTLEHYSGFSVGDVLHLVHVLHNMLSQPPKEHLSTVRNKYSHQVFYEVAKTAVPETINL